MTLRKILAVPAVLALIGFGSAAHAQLWTWSFTDMGVDYSLSFDSLSASGTTGYFTLTLNTSGYNHHADPSYLDSVDIKAWSGTNMSFSLLSGPAGTAWNPAEGSIASGPVGNTGCGGTDSGFACVEAVSKGVLNVDDGTAANPYTFRFEVTTNQGFVTGGPWGVHVGAGYASATGQGAGQDTGGYGITSITSAIPEPETYGMLLAGLGLLFFAFRRREGRPLAA